MGEFEAKERSLNNTLIEICSFSLILLGRKKIFLYPSLAGGGGVERRDEAARGGLYSSPLLSQVPTQGAVQSPQLSVPKDGL